MTPAEQDALARTLVQARVNGTRLDRHPQPAPQSLAEAYEVQDRYIEAMGLSVVGWKVGCTSEAGQTLLDVDQPIAGPLFDTLVHESPATIAVTANDSRIVEAEIALRLNSPLPSRAEPYRIEEVAAAVGRAMPAFELANKRLPGSPVDAAPWLVADGAIDAAVVLGPGVAFDGRDDLTGETITVYLEDRTVTDGVGANALGGPLRVLAWLADHLGARGHGLPADAIISTGVVTGVIIGEPGTVIHAEFSTLGTVEMRLEESGAAV